MKGKSRVWYDWETYKKLPEAARMRDDVLTTPPPEVAEALGMGRNGKVKNLFKSGLTY